MISLVMLSGGIDSTYSLVRLLKETDDEVLAHHIHLVTNTRRHESELKACSDIVAYCQDHLRPFYFTQSLIDRRKFIAHGYDLISAGIEAGIVSASYYLTKKSDVDRWIIGLAKDDIVPRHRFLNAQSGCEFNCQAGSAPELFLFEPVSLQEQAEYLGKDLLDMTWSCRTPVETDEGAKACGNCEPCLRRAKIQEPEAELPASAAITDAELLPWRFVHRHGDVRESRKAQIFLERLQRVRQ